MSSNTRTIALGAVPADGPRPRKYGLISVETHHAHRQRTGEDLHTYLDGEDVTRWTNLCNDAEGWVDLIAFLKGADPARWLQRGGQYVGDATIRVYGNVVIAPAVPA